MPTIRLYRPPEFINSTRQYKIFVDGEKIGTIVNGDTLEFDLPAGTHTMQAKIDWCSSPEFTFSVKNGETKTINVGGFHREEVVYLHTSKLLYYLTVGRKQYLYLEDGMG